jgi:RNA polymerase sigma-70 factor (ECF subfamily)
VGGRTVSILIARAAAGDRDSCAALVERVDPLLLLYARRQLRAPLDARLDAEDVVNDAWARILPHLGEIQPSDGRLTRALLKYAATVINNRLRDLARAHREPVLPVGHANSSEEHARPRIEPAAGGPGIVSVVARRELVTRFQECIAGLPEPDREIILMRGIGQQSNDEVATLLGVRPGTVAVRYHRALERLRKLIPMSVFDDLFVEDS